MLEGLYKVEYSVGETPGRSIMWAHGGRMLGGNSGFAHYGTFEEASGVVTTEIRTQRHTLDPNYPALLGVDDAILIAKGSAIGDVYRFVGGSESLPGAVFRSKMTPLDHEIAVPGRVGEGGIVNGLYSIHIRMLDGIVGSNTGVMLLHDGRILGGDAFFYYLGSYSSANGRWKGEILNQEHTPSRGENPIFGGHEVGIGFFGTCDAASAEAEATALAGKRSVRFTALLKLMQRA